MKLGIIFRPKARKKYGYRKELCGDTIIITKDPYSMGDYLDIKTVHFNKSEQVSYPINIIQFIYFGEWNK